MNLGYSAAELAVCFFLYGFLGWVIRVAVIALKDRHYVNLGMLNLPFSVPFGLTAVILLLALPPLDGHPVLQYLLTWAVMEMAYRVVEQFVKSISRRSMKPSRMPDRPMKLFLRLTAALVHLAVYLVIHPFAAAFLRWMPDWSVITAAVVLAVLMCVDFFSVRHALRTNRVSGGAEGRQAWTQRMGNWVTDRIWKRLEKAYPGVEHLEPEQQNRYVFAQGICFDKLVWVFLISSFLGALIEMVFCRITGGRWMNRSSVLYGAFSFVWGFGAVVLTVVLQHMAGKEDRKVFLAGTVLGGVYEYLCSVFTELVFGTVFWDYSHMPLNIGGRTNVLFCIFWGLLSVAWIKVLYPPMERGIEKIPPLLGKVVTWGIVIVMLCNGVLTACAMCRYTERQTDPRPSNLVEQLLDERYGDGFMEDRWPNMKLTDGA